MNRLFYYGIGVSSLFLITKIVRYLDYTYRIPHTLANKINNTLFSLIPLIPIFEILHGLTVLLKYILSQYGSIHTLYFTLKSSGFIILTIPSIGIVTMLFIFSYCHIGSKMRIYNFM